MKLSTKARYGLRAMLDLAEHYGNGPVQARVIARRQDLSAKYLEHLLAALKAADLVRVLRGARGGYELAQPPERTIVGDVVRALEGSLELVECVPRPDCCPRAATCAAREVWRRTKEAMEGVIDGTTIRDLMERQDVLRSEDSKGAMYHI